MLGVWQNLDVKRAAADCVKDSFPLLTAGRTIKKGLYMGLAFGLVQDALGLARGRRLRYVDYILGKGQAET